MRAPEALPWSSVCEACSMAGSDIAAGGRGGGASEGAGLGGAGDGPAAADLRQAL